MAGASAWAKATWASPTVAGTRVIPLSAVWASVFKFASLESALSATR
jgi:hypothetical protein